MLTAIGKMETFSGKRYDSERKAADTMAKKIEQILLEKEYVILGLPGGTSVSGILQNLKEKKIQWEKVHFFLVDERRVPLDDEESNFKLVKENLLDFLTRGKKISDKNIHPYNYQERVGMYSQELQKFGGSFDIILLSAGEDGHIAGLFPDHSVNNDSDYFIAFDYFLKMPKERMSASRKLLEKSGTALLLFFGEKKLDAYKKFLDENVSVNECPTKLVNKIDESYIFVSED